MLKLYSEHDVMVATATAVGTVRASSQGLVAYNSLTLRATCLPHSKLVLDYCFV